MAEIIDLEDAVAAHLRPGLTVAFEGFTHLIPHAAAHAAIRRAVARGIDDLTLIRMTPDVVYDQMIGMGIVRKLVFSYAGNPGVGLLRRIRDAVEHQWPRPLEVEEHSHAAMASAWEAGAANLPLAVLRGYAGAGLRDVNPNVREIACPFTSERLAAVPALRPDLSVIHAQRADRRGNVLIEGIIGVQKEAALAAAACIVTVEEIVDDLGAHPNACVLPHWAVAAVCETPGGAHPSYAHGYYDRDNAAYLEWDGIAADRDGFRHWMQTNVLDATPADFAARVAPHRKAAA